MKWYKFQVSGWTNLQVVAASSRQDAVEQAERMAHGDWYGLQEITESVYRSIVNSWWVANGN